MLLSHLCSRLPIQQVSVIYFLRNTKFTFNFQLQNILYYYSALSFTAFFFFFFLPQASSCWHSSLLYVEILWAKTWKMLNTSKFLFLPCLFLVLASVVWDGLFLTACRFTSSVPTGSNHSALPKRSVGAQGFTTPWPNLKVSFLNLTKTSPFLVFCTLLILLIFLIIMPNLSNNVRVSIKVYNNQLKVKVFKPYDLADSCIFFNTVSTLIHQTVIQVQREFTIVMVECSENILYNFYNIFSKFVHISGQ